MPITRRIIVTGRVQGVGFRAFVHLHATSLGLQGFVRNLKNGSVEVLVSGEAGRVEQLIAHCRKGPVASRVEKVDISDATLTEANDFRHLPTI